MFLTNQTCLCFCTFRHVIGKSEGFRYVFCLLTKSRSLSTRGDSVFVHVEGAAIIFQSEVTEQDEGLYTCQVSFYHHNVTVNIQVEVMSKDKLFGNWFSFPQI